MIARPTGNLGKTSGGAVQYACDARPHGRVFRWIVGLMAAKAYAWASDAANMARLPAMTRAAFLSEMDAIGVRVS